MSENAAPSSADPVADPRVRLAYERTYLAYERTQMGWTRTALSFISFGFAIAKFFDWLRSSRPAVEPWLGPRTIGIVMIVTGLISLVIAELQHRRAVKIIRRECPDLPPSIAGMTAAFVALLGMLALIGAFLREH